MLHLKEIDMAMDEGGGKPAQVEVEELTDVVEDVEQVKAEADKAHDPMVCTCTCVSVNYNMQQSIVCTWTCIVYFDQFCHYHAHTFILFLHVYTEPTGFIITIGNDHDLYKGSQLSLPPANNQWCKKVRVMVEMALIVEVSLMVE